MSENQEENVDTTELDDLLKADTLPSPDVYIGRTLELEGTPYVVDRIEGIGSTMVAFGLRNMEKDEVDQVLKVFRDTFESLRESDSLSLLRAELYDALPRLEQDPGEVLRLSNQLLERGVDDQEAESIHFNMGTAFLTKGDIPGALAAFERASDIAPDDILNLVHKARCLAQLGCDEICLRTFREASAQDEALKHILRATPRAFAQIRSSLMRTADKEPGNAEVKRLIRRYFGLSYQLRRAFKSS